MKSAGLDTGLTEARRLKNKAQPSAPSWAAWTRRRSASSSSTALRHLHTQRGSRPAHPHQAPHSSLHWVIRRPSTLTTPLTSYCLHPAVRSTQRGGISPSQPHLLQHPRAAARRLRRGCPLGARSPPQSRCRGRHPGRRSRPRTPGRRSPRLQRGTVGWGGATQPGTKGG